MTRRSADAAISTGIVPQPAAAGFEGLGPAVPLCAEADTFMSFDPARAREEIALFAIASAFRTLHRGRKNAVQKVVPLADASSGNPAGRLRSGARKAIKIVAGCTTAVTVAGLSFPVEAGDSLADAFKLLSGTGLSEKGEIKAITAERKVLKGDMVVPCPAQSIYTTTGAYELKGGGKILGKAFSIPGLWTKASGKSDFGVNNCLKDTSGFVSIANAELCPVLKPDEQYALESVCAKPPEQRPELVIALDAEKSYAVTVTPMPGTEEITLTDGDTAKLAGAGTSTLAAAINTACKVSNPFFAAAGRCNIGDGIARTYTDKHAKVSLALRTSWVDTLITKSLPNEYNETVQAFQDSYLKLILATNGGNEQDLRRVVFNLTPESGMPPAPKSLFDGLLTPEELKKQNDYIKQTVTGAAPVLKNSQPYQRAFIESPDGNGYIRNPAATPPGTGTTTPSSAPSIAPVPSAPATTGAKP